jgi:hypothetical protein
MSSTTTPGIDGESAVTGPAEPAITPEAGTEHLTGPEAPVAPEAVPILAAGGAVADVGDAAEPAKPWYRKIPRLAWAGIITAVVAGATALILMLTVFSGSPATGADAILAHDGYSGSISISGSLWQQVLGATGTSQGASAGDIAAAKAMLSSATVGFKGGRTEIVFTLTPAGAALIPAELPSAKPGDFGPGNTAHMDNGYFVIDGPASQLGGPGDYKTTGFTS